MKTLYLNNYKGFVNTFIPFLNVNFFVGENSTGKTAVLNLINIMSDFNFWFSPNFNNDIVELGYFSEIVNQRSANKSFFDIGIEFDDKNPKNYFSKYVYFKFEEKDNRPHVKVYKFINGSHTVTISFFAKTICYQISDYKNESFGNWITHDNEKIGTKHKIRLDQENLPFSFLRNLVSMHLHEKFKDYNIDPLLPPLIDNRLFWLGPIRAKAKRSYEAYKSAFSPEGNHTPIVLNKILSNKDKNSKLIQALCTFGKESGLFDEIEINNFARKKDSPFSININYARLPVRITNVGYGVSQILPIVVEILTLKKGALAIQQPEVHLHPRAQAALGDLIYYSSRTDENRFFVETHSSYTLNRFRFRIFKSNKKHKNDAQVLFFERTNNGTSVISLPFNDQGQYPDSVPESYTKFFIDEEIKMLEF